MSETVRVLVADDSPVFLAAAVTIVAATPGFEIAAVCSSGTQAVETAAGVKPDLALLDQSMLGVDPVGSADAITEVSPETLVVLVSADPYPVGAIALVDKRTLSPERLARLWRDRTAGEGDRAAASPTSDRRGAGARA